MPRSELDESWGSSSVTYPVRRDEDEAARVGRIAEAQAHDGLAEELSGAVDDRDEHVVEWGAPGDRALDPHQAGQEPLPLLELGAQRPVVLVELQLDLQVRPEAFLLGEIAEADDHTVDPGDVAAVGQERLDRTPAIAFAHPESQRPTAVVVGDDLGEAFDDVLNVVGMHDVERLRPGVVRRRDERCAEEVARGTVGVREPEVVVDHDDHVVDAVEQRARVEVRRRRSRWEASPLVYRPSTATAVDVAMNTQRGRQPGAAADARSGRLDQIEDQIDPAATEVDDDEAHRLGEGHGRSTAPARPQHETPAAVGAGAIDHRVCEREPDSSSPGLGDDDHEDLPVVVDTGETHDASLVEGRDPEAGLARAHPRDQRRKRLRPGAVEPAEVSRFRLDLVGEPLDAAVETRMIGGGDAQILDRGDAEIGDEIHATRMRGPMCTARFARVNAAATAVARPFGNVAAVIPA